MSSGSRSFRNREVILRRARAVMRSESDAILDAEKRLGDEFIEAVHAVLGTSGRVCVTGIGKARLIGDKIQATLASTGTMSYSLHPVEALHGDLGMVDSDDVVIGLSKSGGSELVQVLPLMRQRGCTVILLTARPDSKAAEHADIILNIGDVPEACPLGLAPSSSTAAMLAVGDALALTLMELRAVGADQYAAYHPGGALGRSLMRADEIMRTGADCPMVSPEATLSECYEAILKAPCRAGAAVVVDGDGQLVGIVTQGDFFRFFQQDERMADKMVHDVMSRDPKRVHAQDRAAQALEMMRVHSIDEIPVVDDDGKLVGLIDVQDLISRGFSVLDQP
ncbi:MAG: KpsF/GutQ family sugar-phosphate isomerase [Myxococcota bacterium]